MDMASPRVRRASWNPLSMAGTEMEPNLLLASKLMVLAMIVIGYYPASMPEGPFVPLLPILDVLGEPFPFKPFFTTVFILCAGSLLFNHRVRGACMGIGIVLLIDTLSSRADYSNGRALVGMLLLLTGLEGPGRTPWLLRGQLAIVYLGAALSKLLDQDWRAGQALEFLARSYLERGWNPLALTVYVGVADVLPVRWLSAVATWVTIALQLGMAGLCLAPPFRVALIWAGLILHCAILILVGTTINMFFYAMCASLLFFASWPRSTWIVRYNPALGLHAGLFRLLHPLDFDNQFQWDQVDTARRLEAQTDGHLATGFRACRIVLLYTPATYFVLLALLTLGYPRLNFFRQGVTVVALLAFSPLLPWLMGGWRRKR